MSSLLRRIQRKHLRAGSFTTDDDGNQVHVKHEPRPQYTEPRGAGYLTIRYTRGPRLVSGSRLRAQGRLAEIMHPGEMRQQEKSLSRMMSAQDMRQANEKRIDALLATPVATVSRQVRRHAHRTGRALPPLIGAEPKKARKPRAKKADAAQATVA